MAKLFTTGYQLARKVERLIALVKEQNLYVADIRHTPWSADSQWCKEAIEAAFYEAGLVDRYIHIAALGNVNHNKGGAIKLADPAVGAAFVVSGLRSGKDVLLMCACWDAENCHRTVAAEYICQHFPSDVSSWEEIYKYPVLPTPPKIPAKAKAAGQQTLW